MDTFSYKGISDGKYVEGEIEALNQEEASHKLKEQKVIITNLIKSKKKKDKDQKRTDCFNFLRYMNSGLMTRFIETRTS